MWINRLKLWLWKLIIKFKNTNKMCECNSTALPIGPPGPPGTPGDSYFSSAWLDQAFDNTYITADDGTIDNLAAPTSRYKIAGKTLFWTLDLAFDLSATPNQIKITLPTGRAIKKTSKICVVYFSDGVTIFENFVRLVATKDFIEINSVGGSFPSGTDYLLSFTLVFEIE